jgi:hypothetical protein
MPLAEVAPGLWSHVHTLRLPGNVLMPAQMSVARLDGGALWVHSPVPIDDALAAELAALGTVRYAVSPTCLHGRYVAAFVARYPGAQVHGAPGLAPLHPEVTFAGTLATGPSPWSDSLEQLLLEGAPRLNEVVFFHRPSRSLLVSDLFFNITEPASWATGLVTRMAGTYRRFGVSRAWRFYRKDRALLKASVEKMLGWDFVRVLPSHGVVFETADTRADVRARAEWFLR